MIEAVIALGSNKGDRIENLNKAIKSLSYLPEIKINRISNFYETKPFGVPDKQQNYINGCVSLYTNLGAYTLLGGCLGIEAAMGRERKYRFCSRIIDLDLIFYGDQKYNSEELTVPHPRIRERAFVMVPLNDIFKDKKFYDYSFLDALNNICTSDIIKL